MQLHGSLPHDPHYKGKLVPSKTPYTDCHPHFLSGNKEKGFNFKSSSYVIFSVLSISIPCSNCTHFLLLSSLPFLFPLTSLVPCNKLDLALPAHVYQLKIKPSTKELQVLLSWYGERGCKGNIAPLHNTAQSIARHCP